MITDADLPNRDAAQQSSESLRLPELSGRSRELLEALERETSRAGQFYEGALRALADRPNPIRAEMAAYALRELIEELERAASAPKAGPTLGVLLTQFRPKWEAAARRPDGSFVSPDDPALDAVDQFLQDAERGHHGRRDRAQRTFTELDPIGREGPPDTHRQRIEELLEFRDEFNHELHGEHPTDPTTFEARVEGFERFLLEWLRPRTFADFDAIDALLKTRTTDMTGDERTAAVSLIRASAANLEYFFSCQTDGSWLAFLLEEGFFLNPTSPESGQTRDGQTWFRYPYWPESRYLTRIAADVPESVFEATTRIPETTNPRIHQDIVTVAAQLPPKQAAKLAAKETRWLSRYDGHLVSYPRPAGELVAHLAWQGEVGAAFKLSGALLRLSAGPEPEGRGRQRVVGRMSDWEYGEVLEAAWPAMMAADPERAFAFLCHRLAAVIEIGFVEGSSFDPTQMWRPAIENHAQNTSHELLNTLIDAVRDAALESAAEEGGRDLVLTELARHDARMFRRLALFVIASRGSVDQAAGVLTDPCLADEVTLWHEYAELLRARFGHLGPEARSLILALIAAGPDRELTAAQEERGVTFEQFEVRCRYWQLERYALIEDHLSGDARADYEALLAEFGPPNPSTVREVVTTWSAPRAPFSADELATMGPVGALEAIRSWDPEEGQEKSSPEGLGRNLETAVERDPSGFAAIATEFVDVEPECVRGLLGGLGKATQEGRPFLWNEVLGLCEQLGPRPPSVEQASEEEDLTSAVDRAILSLLSDGLREGQGEIPAQERARVWSLIHPHLEDPDPSSAREIGNDPASVAINSVRGEALHAAIRHALWVERALRAEGAYKDIDSLPELAETVERRLNPAADSSLAIRAVLGEWFVQFVRLDERWAASMVPRLFPTDTDSAAFFSAAWNGYIVFNQPWTQVFEILDEHYEVAAERFEKVDEDVYMAANPRERLGEHLFFFRFSGSIDLAEDGVFERFWDVAPVEIRTHVLRDIGWSLEHGNAEMSGEVRERFERTWEWIFDRSREDQASLAAFGAWFGGRQLDDRWLLAQGRTVLDTGALLDPDHPVFEGLARMTEDHPAEVIEILRLMIINDPDNNGVLGSTDDIRATLAGLLSVGEDSARREAVAVLHLLGGRGFTEFRDLLPTGS